MTSRLQSLIFAALAMLTVPAATAIADENKISLFKVVTVKDEIVIGLSSEETRTIGGSDAGAIARAPAWTRRIAAASASAGASFNR